MCARISLFNIIFKRQSPLCILNAFFLARSLTESGCIKGTLLKEIRRNTGLSLVVVVKLGDHVTYYSIHDVAVSFIEIGKIVDIFRYRGRRMRF
jgi:hypothetical protein